MGAATMAGVVMVSAVVWSAAVLLGASEGWRHAFVLLARTLGRLI